MSWCIVTKECVYSPYGTRAAARTANKLYCVPLGKVMRSHNATLLRSSSFNKQLNKMYKKVYTPQDVVMYLYNGVTGPCPAKSGTTI